MFDYVDFQVLQECAGVTREALRSRARELRCTRTLELFFERCDPRGDRFDLGPSTLAQKARWDAIAFPERGPLGWVQLQLSNILKLPTAVPDVLRALPIVLRVRRRLSRATNMHDLLRDLTPTVDTTIDSHSRAKRFRTVRGLRWATRLLLAGFARSSVLHSLAIYSELRGQGWPVEFVGGVRREENGEVVHHAWVEMNGHVLYELWDSEAPWLYGEGFRFPP